MKKLFRTLILVALLPASNAWAVVTDPTILDFECITDNSAFNCAIGEGFMSVLIGTAGGGRTGTDYTFLNTAPSSSGATIDQIYFASSALNGYSLADVNLLNDGFAQFTLDNVNPGNLPGGNEVGFFANFGAEALNPPGGGIGPGEGYTINLSAFFFDAFAAALMGDDFALGIHVQRFADGGSESFVTGIPNPIPVPAAFWLFGTALIGFIGIARRTRL